MRATVLNCSLKTSPQPSSSEALADVVVQALEHEQVEAARFRLADLSLPRGSSRTIPPPPSS